MPNAPIMDAARTDDTTLLNSLLSNLDPRERAELAGTCQAVLDAIQRLNLEGTTR